MINVQRIIINWKKYVSVDSIALQTLWKEDSSFTPLPLENFPLSDPHTPPYFRDHPLGKGMDIFWNHTFRVEFFDGESRVIG